MYLQITTKCNMNCGHCGFSCTAQGENMSIATFKRAVKLANHYGDTISIGGGEPTVHPKFWDMLGWAITHTDCEDNKTWLATNGKKTQDAIRLASLAKSGVISCDLSQDPYHETIDERVIRAFNVRENDRLRDMGINDHRGVRNTSNSLINAGRCDWGEDMCICEDIFVKPNGDIHQCGCADSPKIGNVLTGISGDVEFGTCHTLF